MANQKTKEKLKDLCEKVAKGEKTPDDIINFFQLNRKQVFDIAENWDDFVKNNPTVLYGNILTYMTCSCGSTFDSCKEDGPGKFSTFFFTSFGTVFRKVEFK